MNPHALASIFLQPAQAIQIVSRSKKLAIVAAIKKAVVLVGQKGTARRDIVFDETCLEFPNSRRFWKFQAHYLSVSNDVTIRAVNNNPPINKITPKSKTTFINVFGLLVALPTMMRMR